MADVPLTRTCPYRGLVSAAADHECDGSDFESSVLISLERVFTESPRSVIDCN